MYFLGWDAGATKSEMILTDEAGHIAAHEILGPLPYTLDDNQLLRDRIHNYVGTVTNKAGIRPDEIRSTGIGMPGYGEVLGSEETCEAAFAEVLPAGRFRIVNDCVGGWYGSFLQGFGIHISAGTGSIAYGRDAEGNDLRCAGMSVLLGDEGSCCWIGRQAIIAFIKQADGRAERTALYELMKEHFGTVPKDIYLVGEIAKLQNDPAGLAALQRVTLKAWEQGDQTAVQIYQKAAEELVLMAETIRRKLPTLPQKDTVLSYSGGLFKAGEAIMAPFREITREKGFKLTQPKYPPYIGTLSLAAYGILPDAQRTAMMAEAFSEINSAQGL